MIGYVFNLMLMLAWAAITGVFSLPNLVIGFIIGYLVIAFSLSGQDQFARYVWKVPRALLFFLHFMKDLLMSNLRVAYDVVTPTHLMRPALIRMPLEASTPGEITILANLISLTPGTLSLELDDAQEVLYIHVMYLDGEDVTLASLKDLERRLLELLR